MMFKKFSASSLLSFAALCLLVPAANAVVISTASNGDWEVTTINGNITGELSLLEDQVWFQDQTLAEEFATLVQDSLGLPQSGGTAGPYFVYDVGPTAGTGVRWNDTSSEIQTFGLSLTGGFTFAVATPIQPVPSLAPLGIAALGGLLGFAGWRRLSDDTTNPNGHRADRQRQFKLRFLHHRY